MCYGAVVDNGYGASYNPHKNSITTCITSFKSSPETDSKMFAQSLESSLLQMHELCLKAQTVKAIPEKGEVDSPKLRHQYPRQNSSSGRGCAVSPRRQLARQMNAEQVLANGGAE